MADPLLQLHLPTAEAGIMGVEQQVPTDLEGYLPPVGSRHMLCLELDCSSSPDYGSMERMPTTSTTHTASTTEPTAPKVLMPQTSPFPSHVFAISTAHADATTTTTPHISTRSSETAIPPSITPAWSMWRW